MNLKPISKLYWRGKNLARFFVLESMALVVSFIAVIAIMLVFAWALEYCFAEELYVEPGKKNLVAAIIEAGLFSVSALLSLYVATLAENTKHS